MILSDFSYDKAWFVSSNPSTLCNFKPSHYKNQQSQKISSTKRLSQLTLLTVSFVSNY